MTDHRPSTWRTFLAFVRCLVTTMTGGVAVAVGLSVLAVFTEGFGLLLLIPLLAAVGLDVDQGSVGRLSLQVRGAFAAVGLRTSLEAVLATFVAVTWTQALLTRWQVVCSLSLEQRFVCELRSRLYASIVRAKWLYLSTTRSADLAHVLTAELDRVGFASSQLLSLVSNVLVGAVYVALAFRVSPAMTVLVIGCGAILMVVLHSQLAEFRGRGEAISNTTNALYLTVIEQLAALKTAKSYGLEKQHADNLRLAAGQVATAEIGAIRQHADAQGRFGVGSALVLALLLYAAVRWIQLPAAGVLMLLFLFGRIMPRYSGVLHGVQRMAELLTAFRAADALQRRADAESEPPERPSAGLTFHDSIRFDGVAFAYAADRPLALRDLSLEIRRGSVTAIVGESGAGKSTVADLLLGLQQPLRGRIVVDGIELTGDRLASWKAQIGYVPQDTVLFHDTVRANLRWANPAASDADLQAVLVRSAADGFVATLPQGLDTIVGDRGLALSGGERQRLALARALIRKPRLLVLDEATSALDAENESRILEAIDQLRNTTTVVLITHRVAAVRHADVIHVLSEGRLVESGDWAGLQRRPGGRFRAICSAQAWIPELTTAG